MATYSELVSAVEAYYGSGSDEWYKMATYAASETERYQILKQVPGVSITTNANGSIIGWDYTNPFSSGSNAASAINSNVGNASYGSGSFTAGINATQTVVDPTTTPPKTSLVSGAKTVGTGTRVLTTAAKVASVFCAASLGAKLGKFINANFGGQYAWNDNDWNEWASGLDPVSQTVFRTLFDINGNNTTAYLPEGMLAAAYKMYLEMGAFNTGGYTVDISQVDKTPLDYPNINYDFHLVDVPDAATVTAAYTETYYITSGGTKPVYTVTVFDDKATGSENPTFVYFLSEATFGVKRKHDGKDYGSTLQTRSVSKGGKTFYRAYTSLGWPSSEAVIATNPPYSANVIPDNATISALATDVGYLIFSGTITEEPPVEGITNDPRATTQIDPSQISGTTPETILPQLKQKYPQLFDGSIYEDVPQEDGSSKQIKYIPVPFPKKSADGKPITGTPSQANPAVNPATATPDELADVTNTITGSPTGNPTPSPDAPTTGTGESPTPVMPTGSASSLWAVYNPTQAQVNSFGSWLWSSDFIEQIKKLFNDPMQAIIGIHKVFATPSTSGSQTIKCGYIDSNVSAAVVSSQYTDINCGSVDLREYFGNVFDYAPFTEISLYLPFIGIVKLDVSDVMRSTINVKYHVDVITGACLADVKVSRDANNSVLYQYAGSCIVTYPLSSGSYASALAGIVSIAGGAVASVASGGALAPVAIGAAVGATKLHSDVQKSGSFTGAAGAMGCKKPYLIISRPQTALPSNYKKYEGNPSRTYISVKDCSGYIKVSDVHVKNTNASNTELDMIESLLKTGIEV